MSKVLDNPEFVQENHPPRLKQEYLTLLRHGDFTSDAVIDPYKGGHPPYAFHKIKDYRRIQSWENYFLCSAICSVGKKLGSDIDDFHFYANFTGDNFTYLYAAEKGNPDNIPCDSSMTNYFFAPEFVKNAYAVFGYKCIYLSNAQIKKNFRASMNMIKASVDREIPVLAWGIGNVTMRSGDHYDPLPEACLIGGYDKDDVLYVNLYPGPERLPKDSVDEYGYYAIINGLDATKGLFFAGEKIEGNPGMREFYESVIKTIPAFLTQPPTQGDGGRWAFGKTAFKIWADTMETDLYFDNKTDRELGEICWNLHCSPLCNICTNTAYEFFKDAVEKYPDLVMAEKLLPLYEKMQNYRQEIWNLHGNFFPPMEKLRMHEFRGKIAKILRQMADVCDAILLAFE